MCLHKIFNFNVIFKLAVTYPRYNLIDNDTHLKYQKLSLKGNAHRIKSIKTYRLLIRKRLLQRIFSFSIS